MASPHRFDGDLFIPIYRPLACGDWELRVSEFGFTPGYWSEGGLLAGMAALVRHGRAWMSITPFELESQEIGIRHADGHVLIFGLGMGWAAAASAAIPAVAAVTVVEQDPDVLALHRALDLFSQLPDAARAKLRLVEADARAYEPDAPVDLLMPDIWLPLVEDGRLDEVRAMQANVGAASVYFWGQELELARHAVAAGRALDEAGITATVAETGLPLVGPGGPLYAERLAAATRRWIRGPLAARKRAARRPHMNAPFAGRCHCGGVKFSFETARPLAPRACQCGFCRRHGARTVTDPGGSAVLTLGPEAWFYRFATRSADYVLCRRCGVYLGAVAVIGGRTLATLNLNAFDDPRLDVDAAPVSYEGETADQKAARRLRAWTPARLREG